MTGVIIGRFQVPRLHLGHIHLISSALQGSDQVVILLGYGEINDRNPYTIGHRSTIIHKIFPQLVIIPLPDVPGNDESWSFQIDHICMHFDKPVLIHSRDSFKDHYKGIFDLYEVPELPGYSGTQLRAKLKTN